MTRIPLILLNLISYFICLKNAKKSISLKGFLLGSISSDVTGVGTNGYLRAGMSQRLLDVNYTRPHARLDFDQPCPPSTTSSIPTPSFNDQQHTNLFQVQRTFCAYSNSIPQYILSHILHPGHWSTVTNMADHITSKLNPDTHLILVRL